MENINGSLKLTETKKTSLHKAIFSLMVEWNGFEEHLDSTLRSMQKCANDRGSVPDKQVLEHDEAEIIQKSIDEKLKEINAKEVFFENRTKELDLIQVSLDRRAELIDMKEENFKERMKCLESKEKEAERVRVLSEERFKEIEAKEKEMGFVLKFIEERAKELEAKQKEIDEGYRELRLKGKQFTDGPHSPEETEQIGGAASMLIGNADVVRPEPPVNNVREPPPELENQNHIIPDVSNSEPLNHHQPTPDLCDSQQSFWMSCPFCNLNYPYYKDCLDCGLQCPHCSKVVILYKPSPQTVAPGVTSGSISGQPAFSQKKGPKKNATKVGELIIEGFRTSNSEYKANSSQTGKTGEVDQGLKTNVKEHVHEIIEDRNRGVEMLKVYSKAGESGALRNSIGTRKRKFNGSVSDGSGGLVPQKWSRLSKLSSNFDEELKGCTPAEGSLLYIESGSNSDPDFYEFSDSDFSNFDKDKEEKCFSVGQIWATYDSFDGMPRFYAQVRKVVFSPEFKLCITWLEPHPKEKGEINWVKTGLPMSCGNFLSTRSEETLNHLCFSHRIHFEKVNGRSYLIHPRKGETWAVFKNWDIRWSYNPDNHRQYIFEIVEILSDFNHDTGIKVVYLEKMKGFVSLFQRGDPLSVLIPSCQMLRFSHQIPSFKMTGAERKDVPKGSFELDPASLPTNLNEPYPPHKVKIETNSKVMNVNYLCSRPSVDKVNFTMDSKKWSTETNCVDVEQMIASDERFLTGSLKHLNGSKDKRCGDFSPSEGNSSVRPVNLNVKTDTSPINFMKNLITPPSISAGAKVSGQHFYNFSKNKSMVKFKRGQIWAMYSTKDAMPRNYALIKKVDSSLFSLHAALLEPLTPVQSLCCGVFRVQNEKPKICSPSSFSHMVKVKPIGKNQYDIYPIPGEIWAIYKNWKAKPSRFDSFDLKDCEYEIVEVLESNAHGIGVSRLVQLAGFKSVFKSRSREGSSTSVFSILWEETARFSHHIPAVQLSGENNGHLRGCWELDPASVPNHMLSVN